MYNKISSFNDLMFGDSITVTNKNTEVVVCTGTVTNLTFNDEDTLKNSVGINNVDYCFNDYDFYTEVVDNKL